MVNDILRVRVLCYTATQISFNILHFKVVTSVPPVPTLQQYATFFDGIFAPLWKPILSVAYRYRGVGVSKILPLPPSLEATQVGNDGVGSVAGDPLPLQIAGLVNLKTAFAGRRFRGRIYLPFPSETDNTAGSAPSAAYLTNATTLANSLVAGYVVPGTGGNEGVSLVILHRALQTSDFVASSVVRPAWATQRRRGAFGAPNSVPF